MMDLNHRTPSNEDVGQNEWPQSPESATPRLFQLDGLKTMMLQLHPQ